MSTYILAIETATEACSVALMRDHEIIMEYFTISFLREHTKLILPMIDRVLATGGISLNRIDALALSRGPGSFTGIRLGFGIAQGLALGVNLPLISISTLAIVAQGSWKKTGINKVLTAIKARKKEVYWAQYERNNQGNWLAAESEKVIVIDSVTSLITELTGRWAIAGTGWKDIPTLIQNDQVTLIHGKTPLPSAQDMLPLALYQWEHGQVKTVDEVKLTYLMNGVSGS